MSLLCYRLASIFVVHYHMLLKVKVVYHLKTNKYTSKFSLPPVVSWFKHATEAQGNPASGANCSSEEKKTRQSRQSQRHIFSSFFSESHNHVNHANHNVIFFFYLIT